jgi:hypothetical protein
MTAAMTGDALDPLIHVPARLRIVATLAAHLAAGASREDHLAPEPGVRIGDADRDTAASQETPPRHRGSTRGG